MTIRTIAVTMANFGRRLRQIRKTRRLTQNQLAEMVDVQAAVVSRWENDVSKPHYDFIVKIARVLEVSFDQLLGDQDTEDAKPDFDIRNRRLKELCRQVDQLGNADQDVICHVMDSLIRKERMRAVIDA